MKAIQTTAILQGDGIATIVEPIAITVNKTHLQITNVYGQVMTVNISEEQYGEAIKALQKGTS